MKDRMSKNPGRVLITPEDGYAPFYATMTRADNPTQEGDPLCKETLLKDATAALFGLGADAVPDDVLSMLYRVVNYAWKRIPAGYTEKQTSWGSGTTFYFARGENSSACSRTVEYSAEIEVDSTTGEISLRSPQTVTVTYSDYSTTGELLKGKYVKNTYSSPDDIVFIPSDATFAKSNASSDYWVYVVKPYVVSTEITVTGDWSIVYAPYRNAYPDSGFSNGYVYVFLGKPLDNATSAAKIETGSYVGTGTYGVDNPNQIVLPFPPQFFAIIPETGSQNNHLAVIGIPGTLSLKYNAYSGSSDYYDATKIEAIGNVLQWYSASDAANQLNYNGTTYKYVVFG